VKTLTFKVSDDVARQLKDEARQERVSLSELVRRRLRAGSSDELLVSRELCPESGVEVFTSKGKLQPLTTEIVKEYLANFP
jgi:hypothetical protein